MSILTSVTVEVEDTLYGRPVTERWTVTRSDTGLSFSVEVRPASGNGSKMLLKEKGFGREHVPDRVLDLMKVSAAELSDQL